MILVETLTDMKLDLDVSASYSNDLHIQALLHKNRMDDRIFSMRDGDRSREVKVRREQKAAIFSIKVQWLNEI